jgi:CheY-like chemotaxis protein
MSPAFRILLAEDNPGDVFLVREALQRHCSEYALTVVSDGNTAWDLIEAVEKQAAQSFEIVMLDLNLPTRSGLELLRRIRRSPHAISRAVVVIVTSSHSASDRNAARRLGVDYYFCKPSNLNDFLKLGSVVQELWIARQQQLSR